MLRLPALVGVLLAGLGLGGLPGTAAAQTIELEPSAVAACLTLPPGGADQPEYPFAAYKAGAPGRVLVELHFTGADVRPAVEVLSSSGDDSFVDAVRDHVRRLRVPCLPPGKDARLRQEYLFQANSQPVVWGPPADARDAARTALLRCMKHVSGDRAPDYPRRLVQAGVQGRVMAQLVFTSDDQAPAVTVLNRPSAGGLGQVVDAWVRGYRLPCFSGEPIATNMTFVFKLGDGAFGFRPMSLQTFAARTRQLKTQGLQLDTRAMACPFDVKLIYRQPYKPNSVGVVGPPDLRRQPLLDWLRRAELELDETMTDSVFADSADIHVPCADFAIPPAALP